MARVTDRPGLARFALATLPTPLDSRPPAAGNGRRPAGLDQAGRSDGLRHRGQQGPGLGAPHRRRPVPGVRRARHRRRGRLQLLCCHRGRGSGGRSGLPSGALRRGARGRPRAGPSQSGGGARSRRPGPLHRATRPRGGRRRHRGSGRRADISGLPALRHAPRRGHRGRRRGVRVGLRRAGRAARRGRPRRPRRHRRGDRLRRHPGRADGRPGRAWRPRPGPVGALADPRSHRQPAPGRHPRHRGRPGPGLRFPFGPAPGVD